MTQGSDPRRANQTRPTRRGFLVVRATPAIVAAVPGCWGGGSVGGIPSATRTPASVSLPYTATNGGKNVDEARSLTINNENTIQHEVSLRVTEKTTGRPSIPTDECSEI